MTPKFEHIEEDVWIRIYNPNDEEIAHTNNEIDFINFRTKIKENKVSGYYFIIDGEEEKIEILNNGRVSKGCKYPFVLYERLLDKIIGLD